MYFRGTIKEEEVVALLGDLIRINSVNPLEDVSAEGEKELAFYIRDYLEDIGIQTSLQWILPERPNVIGILEGTRKGKKFILEAHMDTVRIDNMSIDPFLPKIKEGKMFGRGACDDKGSLTAMLLAMKLLKQKRTCLKGIVYFTAVIDEEHKQRGISYLLSEEFKVDAGIVGEPTNLDIVVAHKGIVRWRVVTEGVACHSSEPEKGENAICSMAQVIDVLQRKLVPVYRKRSHSLVGSPTLSINVIRGGNQINIVPDKCFIEIDRRTIPEEDYRSVLQEVDEVLEELRQESRFLKVEREKPYLVSPPMEVNKNERIVKTLFESVKDNMRSEANIKGAKFDSDAGKLVAKGICAPVFGPGNILQAHSKDEWVELRQVVQAAEIIADAVLIYQNEMI